MKNKKLYLLRHGATELPGLYVGVTEVSLSEEGRAQIMRMAGVLADKCIEHVFCSPMKRCLETLDLLQLEASVERDENLREIDFGRWEGRSFKDIAQSDGPLVENWRTHSESFCFPDGECVETFKRRVDLFVKKVLAASENRILILAHGGIIRQLLCTFLDLSPEKRMIFDIQAGRVSSVTLHGDVGALTSLNVKG